CPRRRGRARSDWKPGSVRCCPMLPGADGNVLGGLLPPSGRDRLANSGWPVCQLGGLLGRLPLAAQLIGSKVLPSLRGGSLPVCHGVSGALAVWLFLAGNSAVWQETGAGYDVSPCFSPALPLLALSLAGNSPFWQD